MDSANDKQAGAPGADGELVPIPSDEERAYEHRNLMKIPVGERFRLMIEGEPCVDTIGNTTVNCGGTPLAPRTVGPSENDA